MTWRAFLSRWFPPLRRPDGVRTALARFYRERPEYFDMTAVDAAGHRPQIDLLQTLIRTNGRYLDIGCGSGSVAYVVGESAQVVGLDAAAVALRKARENQPNRSCEWVQGSAEALPFADASFDGAYSFEAFEHLWHPEAAVCEAIRVVRPGGFLLLSMPNGFSLDLHLAKHALAHLLDGVAAGLRRTLDHVSGRPFRFCRPVLEGPLFPDCDRVTSVVPANLARFMAARGCRLVFWDTYYLQAHMQPAKASLALQRNAGAWLKRHFGDHLLLLARKESH